MIEYKDCIKFYSSLQEQAYIEDNVFITDVIPFDSEDHKYKVEFIKKNGNKDHWYIKSPGSGFVIDGKKVLVRKGHLLEDSDINKVKINLHNHQMLLALENIE